MFSSLYRWPAWLFVLLICGWLGTDLVSANKGNQPQLPVIADQELTSDSVSDDNDATPDTQTPSSQGTAVPEDKTTSSTSHSFATPATPVLSSREWVARTIQQWLKRRPDPGTILLTPATETPAPQTGLFIESYEPAPAAPTTIAGPAEPLAPPPVHHLKVMLDWYPSPRHAALFIAQQRNLFQQRGLEVELLTPADPQAPAKLLAAGQVDLALARQPLLHLLVSEGKPLIRVASLIRLPLSFLLLNDSGIEEMDLADGARVGHLDRDGRQILLPALLDTLGMRPEQIESPKVHFRVDTAMLEGSVDAMLGAMQHEVIETLANGGQATRTYPVTDLGIPLHDGLIVIANRDRLEQQRDAIHGFVEAIEEATAWIINHPDESWTLLSSAAPGMDSRYNRLAWPEVRARLSLSPAALSQGRYASFEQYLFDNGIVEQLMPVERLALDPGAPRSP